MLDYGKCSFVTVAIANKFCETAITDRLFQLEQIAPLSKV